MSVDGNLDTLEALAELTLNARENVALTQKAKELLGEAAGLIIKASDADRDYIDPSRTSEEPF